MFDCHVHPSYSPDATGSIQDYCRRAREVGLAGLCFTTHYEPDPERSEREWVIVRGERRPVVSDWPTEYLDEIARARDEFPDLVILAGVEVGYEMGAEGLIGEFLESRRFDYVLGAVHCLEHVAISGGREVGLMKEMLVPRGPAWVANRYFDYLHAAAESRLFDCLAHLDIYRKYLLPVWQHAPGEEEFRRVAEARVGPALDRLAERDVGIELNSSAFRRGEAEPYPSVEFVSRALTSGVKVFTTGSDAHCPADLGRDLDRVVAILAGLYIEPSAFADRRRFGQGEVGSRPIG